MRIICAKKRGLGRIIKRTPSPIARTALIFRVRRPTLEWCAEEASRNNAPEGDADDEATSVVNMGSKGTHLSFSGEAARKRVLT